MIETIPFLFTAFIMGIAGSGHCLAMCGGLAAAMGIKHTPSRLLFYNLGRIFSYSIAGLVVGGALFSVSTLYPDTLIVLRLLAGVFMLLIGIYVIGWRHTLLWVEAAGSRLWRLLQPLSRFFPRERQSHHVFLAGMLWGWLPCGLVYSALAWSAMAAHPFHGASFMLIFGLGTLPSMFLTGIFSYQLQNFLRSYGFRWIAGLFMIGYGIVTLAIAVKQLHLFA